jgi:lysophospholipase L1-like esterase
MDKFKRNITTIITHPSIVAHKPKILLITPPPLDQIRITVLDLANGHPAATRHAKISAAYSETIREIASEHPEVTLIDLWKALMDTAVSKTPDHDPNGPNLGDPEGGKRGYLEHLLPDGLHMSGESYKILFSLVKPHIGTEWVGKEDYAGFTLPEWRIAPWLED